jgi:hypothetical protein
MTPARYFAKAILLVCLPLAVAVFGSASSGLAQDDAGGRGAKGPIGKPDLLKALARQARGGTKVAGHVVSGKDVIDILRQGGVPIELRDCVIEDGLDLRESSVVTVPITIENCEVRAAPLTRAPSAGTAIYARGTKFDGQVTFRSSTLDGPVRGELRGRPFFRSRLFLAVPLQKRPIRCRVLRRGGRLSTRRIRQLGLFRPGRLCRPSRFPRGRLSRRTRLSCHIPGARLVR